MHKRPNPFRLSDKDISLVLPFIEEIVPVFLGILDKHVTIGNRVERTFPNRFRDTLHIFILVIIIHNATRYIVHGNPRGRIIILP